MNFLNKKIKVKNFIFVMLALFLVIFLVFGYKINIHEKIKDYLFILSNVFTIIAITGVVLAFVNYFKNKKEQKKHVLLALKNQLDVIGVWSGFNGPGYTALEKENILNRNKQIWCDPFHLIFNTESTALQFIWNLPGVSFLSKEIIEKIIPFNQELMSFNNYLNEIKTFTKTIDSLVSINIHKKLVSNLNPFALNNEFTDQEKNICEQIFGMYVTLHFDLIGDMTINKLHKKHKDLYALVQNELKKY